VIVEAIEAQVDITLVDAELLELKQGERFAPSTIWRSLNRRGLSLEKTAHASEQERPDVAALYEPMTTISGPMNSLPPRSAASPNGPPAHYRRASFAARGVS